MNRFRLLHLEVALALATTAAGIWISGVFDRQRPSWPWVVIALVLYALPWIGIFWRKPAVIRTASAWISIALLLQIPLTRLVVDPDYKTLPPNLIRQVLIAPNSIVGIHGLQSITTDAIGFRVTKPVDYNATDKVRIFAVGGSTTEQIALDDDATWTHLLEQNLDPDFGGKVEVVNTGVSGLRAVHHVATLRHIARYHPSLVLITVGVNDWNKQIKEHFGATTYDRPTRFRETLIGRALDLLLQLREGRSHGQLASFDGSYYKGRSNALERPDRRTYRPTDVAPGYRANIAEIARVCAENRMHCVLVTQPTAYSQSIAPALRERLWMTPPDESWTLDLDSLIYISGLYNRTLIELGCKYRLPVIDLAKGLPATFDVFFDDVHYNEAGAKEIAARLTAPVRALLKQPEDNHDSTPGIASCASVQQTATAPRD